MLPLLTASCSPAPSSAQLVLVDPPQGFTDLPLVLRVEVQGLRPALEIDVDKGTLAADLRSVKAQLVGQGTNADAAPPLEPLDWDSHENFWVRVPAGLNPGSYDLDLTDPRGQHLRLPDAFVALGLDTVPPSLQLVQETGAVPVLADDSMLGETQQVEATLIANDGWGGLEQVHWETSDGTAGDCPTPADMQLVLAADPRRPAVREISCPVRWTVPRLAEQAPSIARAEFHAWARDLAGNEVAMDLGLRIGRHPVITEFAPARGGLGGVQPITVWGRGFIAGSRALLDGVPILGTAVGGDIQNESLISGWTPPRSRPGTVRVQVMSAAGVALADKIFTYVAPPLPRAINPSHGSRLGGYRVTISGNDLGDGATVFAGATPGTRQRLTYPIYDAVNRTKIIACMPPGTGTASVWVYDQIAGDGSLPMAFTYDDSDSASSGSGTLPVKDCQ